MAILVSLLTQKLSDWLEARTLDQSRLLLSKRQIHKTRYLDGMTGTVPNGIPTSDYASSCDVPFQLFRALANSHACEATERDDTDNDNPRQSYCTRSKCTIVCIQTFKTATRE